jgi:hypothetical protein
LSEEAVELVYALVCDLEDVTVVVFGGLGAGAFDQSVSLEGLDGLVDLAGVDLPCRPEPFWELVTKLIRVSRAVK